jgi:hypothetical protein
LPEPTTTEKLSLEELIAKRNLLFLRLVKNPGEIHLSIEIKEFDDQIAASTERRSEEKRRAQRRKANDAALPDKNSGRRR